MSKLLSEEELRQKIIAVFAESIGDVVDDTDDIVALIESQKKAFAEIVVDIDTDVDIPEALKKIYSDGYSKGYNDRTYENSYNSDDFRMAEAIAPAVAKVRSRYDKQLKALEEV